MAMSTSEKYPWHGIWGRRWKYALAHRKVAWLSSIPRSTLSRAARYKPNLRTQRRAGRSRHAPGAIATFRSEVLATVWSNCGRLSEIAQLRSDPPEKQGSAMGLSAKCHYINARAQHINARAQHINARAQHINARAQHINAR